MLISALFWYEHISLPRPEGMSTRQLLSFLDLPFEIRSPIYQYCFVHQPVYRVPLKIEKWYISGRGANDRVKSLLFVCKKISNEAITVLYGENIF
jgi:hypothetical protein